jgi:signal transduction histidine kinase
MKFFSFCILLSFCFLSKAQESNSAINLNAIEVSTNYEKNILKLENDLKVNQHSAEELLKTQILLITNYINVFDFSKATSLCQKEILAAKKNKLPLNEATLYRYLGNVYYHLKQTNQAKIHWKKSLEIAEEHQYFELLKRCNHNLGVIALETENNSSKAESYFLKAIEYGKKTKSTRNENLASSYRLLATTYDVMGRYTAADSLFELTTEVCKMFNDSAGIAEALTFRARLFLSMKDYNKALVLIKESIIISEQLHLDDYTQTALSILQRISEESGNYKEAYFAINKMFRIEVAKNARNQKKEIADSEAKFKLAEFKNKQDLLELQATQTKYNYIAFFTILLLITTGTIAFIYQKRLSKREQIAKLKNLKDIYDAEENERSRIAKDLHDNMGAYATSMLSQIDTLEQSKLDMERLKDLRADAEFIMSTLRETIWILKSKTLTIQQFFDLIKIYADKQLVKNLSLKVTFNEEISNLKSINPTLSLNLYRIVQEVIQNIIKHSHAKTIQFVFSCKTKIRIEIIDDGTGFDTISLTRKSGLENMQFRANEINYDFTIESKINEGTKITLQEQ